jgi:hypothetical protein
MLLKIGCISFCAATGVDMMIRRGDDTNKLWEDVDWMATEAIGWRSINSWTIGASTEANEAVTHGKMGLQTERERRLAGTDELLRNIHPLSARARSQLPEGATLKEELRD